MTDKIEDIDTAQIGRIVARVLECAECGKATDTFSLIRYLDLEPGPNSVDIPLCVDCFQEMKKGWVKQSEAEKSK